MLRVLRVLSGERRLHLRLTLRHSLPALLIGPRCRPELFAAPRVDALQQAPVVSQELRLFIQLAEP